MRKTQEDVKEREESEARVFILSAIERGWSAEDILDELVCLFDSDPLGLFEATLTGSSRLA